MSAISINNFRDRAAELGAYVLLDVRTQQEYREGRLPGSKNIPLPCIEEMLETVEDKDTPILVYCRSGARSGLAAAELRKMGYTNVENLGGIASYTGEVER